MERYRCQNHFYYEGYEPCPDCTPKNPEDGFYLVRRGGEEMIVRLSGGEVHEPGRHEPLSWAGYADEWHGPLDLGRLWPSDADNAC